MATATHIGGSIYIGHAHGGGVQPISLRKAEQTRDWLTEALAREPEAFPSDLTREMAREAVALSLAVDRCREWRRAGGWTDPYAADRPLNLNLTKDNDDGRRAAH